MKGRTTSDAVKNYSSLHGTLDHCFCRRHVTTVIIKGYYVIICPDCKKPTVGSTPAETMAKWNINQRRLRRGIQEEERSREEKT